jgi:hypothetical protein
MWITAVLAVLAALIAAVGLPRHVSLRESPRKYHCAVDGTPVQAELTDAPLRD